MTKMNMPLGYLDQGFPKKSKEFAQRPKDLKNKNIGMCKGIKETMRSSGCPWGEML